MNEHMSSLKLQRKQIKASLTRAATFLDKHDAVPQPEQLKARYEKLKDLYDEFDRIQSEIEEVDEAQFDSNERDEFEDRYFILEARFRQAIGTTEAQTARDGIVSTSGTDVLKLPKIELPKFSGAYEDWLSFYDTFSSLIHNNANIPQVQKFHYLKSCLKGEATNVIHSLEISADNYETAWQMLQERYSNQRIIVQKHINAIFELPVATKENATTLRLILDGALKHTRALAALKRPTEYWDDLLIVILTKKLDHQTLKEWETKIKSTEIPTFKEMINFLTQKCQTLETISKITKTHIREPTKTHQRAAINVATDKATEKASIPCIYCKMQNHVIYDCKKFLALDPSKRLREMQIRRCCVNCLKNNHIASNCRSKWSCKICHKKHNSLLHIGKNKAHSRPSSPEPGCSTSTSHSCNISNSIVFLSTALVDIKDKKGYKRRCRVLLDCGSQSNLITQKMANYLGLQRKPSNITLTGITQAKTQITQSVDVSITSRCTAFNATINCLVLDKISENLPPVSMPQEQVRQIGIPRNIKLADPGFHTANDIDMLIGVELFYKLLCVGQINLSRSGLCLQKTLLGWIISGRVLAPQLSTSLSICNTATLQSLNKIISKFWEVETIPDKLAFSQEEKLCEQHFNRTAQRDADGRFIVSLPFKENLNSLGNSYDQAFKRFISLEKKLNKDPSLKQEYVSFMNEYGELGHMRPVNTNHCDTKSHFYLPHHAVFKENSLTTKVRVVFDGSAKTTTGVSLNDVMMVGPKLQQDLFDIVCRFRLHKYALTADVTKMYRQVNIAENCMPFQRILWRKSEKDDIQTFELTTVTYGTASASYLAIKVLQQLAIAEQEEQPFGSQIILRDFYVDDLLTGAENEGDVKRIIDEVTNILSKGKFELRKWASNQPKLLDQIPNSSNNNTVLDLDKNEGVNTLGLQWSITTDALQYSVTEIPKTKTITKRQILSHISKIFDPLGIVSPFILRAKILMQEIWKLKVDWDESLPLNIQSTWLSYVEEICELNEIKIPRHAISIEQPIRFELHGFCDASEKAYGACIYLRTVNTYGNVSCNLLCSKSRIAPIKAISMPRLELCGAVLLAQLISRVTQSLALRLHKIYCWTDSSIVLSWLQSPKAFKTFVANRIAQIQELTEVSDWFHISSKENPADLISRGSSPSVLLNTPLWWNGPEFLKFECDTWPIFEPKQMENLPEVKAMLVSATQENTLDIFQRYSNLNKLKRVIAYCLRFKNNVKGRIESAPSNIETGYLTSTELNHAMKVLITLTQKEGFSNEYRQLQNASNIDAKSKLLCLNPFMDDEGIIRVGGRLKHSNIPYPQKHQILLPAKHPFTKLIILNEHVKQLHAGTQQTIAAIRTKYWPLSLRNSVKATIKRCMICFKAKPINMEYIMGNLPEHRVTPAKPFENIGVDYFGPIQIRENMKRKANLIKSYGAVFVCFATKAVHIELVSNLSTEAFLAALRRLLARRGKISNIYSDNGTQFVGANTELKRLRLQLEKQIKAEEVKAYLADKNIKWHFIPPRSPHFGGLWESAVKSVKLHLTKIIGKASLTYEEMYTLLVQIEGILNSRPLTPISDDPNDLTYLTPSHFLTGDTATSLAEPNLSQLKINSLSRWQHIQYIREHFWRRWKREYLNQLQSRNKWKRNRNIGLVPGNLVIIHDDNCAPSHWLLGRIVETFPGKDGIVRTASVQTARGITHRPTVKLYPLPINQD